MRNYFEKEASSLFVGLDELINSAEEFFGQYGKVINKFPPYNIKKLEDNKYVIEMAVAGFGKQDLEIEIDKGTLVVKGNVESKDEDGVIYKGIADRAFTRTFKIRDSYEVKNAELFNGMLKIVLNSLASKEKTKIDIIDKTEEE